MKIAKLIYLGTLILIFGTSLPVSADEQVYREQLKAIVDGDHRLAFRRERDPYRHPVETLMFFGIKPEMTVVEIDPSWGWYADIIAPFVREQGQYIAAGRVYTRAREAFAERPEIYGKPVFTKDEAVLSQAMPPWKFTIAEKASVDMVLSFRNIHNWMRGDGNCSQQGEREVCPGYAAEYFAAMFEVLKPGGILGVVEHRRKADDPAGREAYASGYVNEEYAIELAEAVGFVLEGRSEVNNNPKDSTYHEQGVWTLPPAMNLGERDQEKYLAIGESDRFTLRFVKPK